MSKSERMPKRQALIPEQPGPLTDLRRALTKSKKSELVDILMELAQADRGVLRQLSARFEDATAPEKLITRTLQAIKEATAFDRRDMNRNFAYDHDAYAEVKRNLARLIASGQFSAAMQLALELMKRGSFQVEMSDEGMMTHEIEDCLNVVIESLGKGNVAAQEVNTWCTVMLATDRVDFIAREQIEALLRGSSEETG
jgi:hypothetical protein